ncbi:unnamed protein product [Nippostrongylus brasiliensis]|uniref:Uncharacterized protein n=1 Tax=Nippostrongylus brasiliensis TaxID=27835 RepID=A0A0N4YWV0_NIPBR|nr:unnamed protein product [Nippostrongylus brasiliensis]
MAGELLCEFAMIWLMLRPPEEQLSYARQLIPYAVGSASDLISMLMVELFAPASALRPRCEWLWRNSSDYGTLSRFTVCCREVLQAANISNVYVYEKGTGWARDGWLTNSHWNPDVDFMFHARKEADKIRYKPADIGKLTGLEYFPWFDTLSSPVRVEQCGNGT